MKKLLLILVALFSIVGTMPTTAAPRRTAPAREQHTKRNIMELPIVVRAILIIRKFETLHSLRHLPYCGYGHRIWPGENLPRHRALTEREADALLRKDFAKLCAMYSHLGKDSVLAAALAYNIGPGAVNKSTFYKKLKHGDRNIYKEYISYCNYRGKFHSQLYLRRMTEYASLFIQ
ncbi:MAG: lysozyme [Muribaculum sp.]|nr:lysozyme [Muribaculum sp.]